MKSCDYYNSELSTVSQVRKLRYREVRSLAQSYTVRVRVAQLELCPRESQCVMGDQKRAPDRTDQGGLPGGDSI